MREKGVGIGILRTNPIVCLLGTFYFAFVLYQLFFLLNANSAMNVINPLIINISNPN